MSATNAPFGVRVVYHPSGVIRTRTLTGFSSIPSSAVYRGDLVKLTGGTDVASIIAANDAAFGVFDGCRYTDSTGRPTYSPFWPASLSGVTNIEWYVIPFDPLMECEIQAGGSIANTAIGDSADIVIAAIGRPEFVTADMVKEGAVVIDVGTTRVPDATRKSGFRLCGDVKFDEVAPKCSYITPVPGGVGPMTICSLMKNTLAAGKKEYYK